MITMTTVGSILDYEIPSTSGLHYPKMTVVSQFKQPNIKEIYISIAMNFGKYEKLQDGSVYGEISECPGVWANEKTKERCATVIKEVLSDWINLKLKDKDRDLPILGNINLNTE